MQHKNQTFEVSASEASLFSLVPFNSLTFPFRFSMGSVWVSSRFFSTLSISFQVPSLNATFG